MEKFPLVKCPYCFEEIRYNDAVFRCDTGNMSVDMFLKSYHQENGNYAYERLDFPVVDPADLPREKLEIDNENYITGVENPNLASRMPLKKRLCPYCHNNLLVNFGKRETKYIAVVGVPNSGKTTYLAAVNNCMRNREWNWSSLSKENSPLENVTELYRNNNNRAQVATRGVQGPYLYGLKYSPNGEQSSQVDSHIVFFDIPGEFYTKVDRITYSLNNFLSNADGIIFVVNAAEEVEHQEIIKNGGHANLVKVTDILDAFDQAGIIKGKKCAIIFNKIDLIEGQLGIDAATKMMLFPRRTNTAIDMEAINEVSNYTMTVLLNDEQHGNQTTDALRRYARKIQETFGNDSKVFATRLLRQDPQNPDGFIFNSDGAETPFLWLLSEIGAFPVKADKEKEA